MGRLPTVEKPGSSFTQIANGVVEEADVVGYGEAAAGKTYLAIYITRKFSGKRGVFQTADKGGPRFVSMTILTSTAV